METEKLILFLKNLTNSLENNELSDDQVMKIGEFYMAYEFGNALNSDETLDIDEKDFIKFMVLGWYIYCVILRSKKFNDMPKLIKIKEE